MSGTLLSIKQVSKIAGVSSQRIHRDIRKKKLKASKLGWIWVIDEIALTDYLSYLASLPADKKKTTIE